MTLIERALEVGELVKQFHNVRPSNTSDWVPAGLMSEEEYAIYREASHVRQLAYEARRAAEDTVKSGDYYVGFPEEFVALDTERNELRAKKQQYRAALDGLKSLASIGSWSRSIISERFFRHRDLAHKAIQKLENDPEFQYVFERLPELVRLIEPKERKGTKVHQIREATYPQYWRARIEVGEAAEQKVLSEHYHILAEGKRVEELMKQRVAQRQTDILREIYLLLK